MIDILIVNYNTSDFVLASVKLIQQLTQNPFQIYICDNGSNPAEAEKLRIDSQDFPNSKVFWKNQSRPGSWGHAEALDFLVSHSKSEVFVVLDADCLILRKNWDTFLMESLSQGHCCFGTPPVHEQTKKPIDFPCVYLLGIRRNDWKKGNLSFLPDLDNKKGYSDTGYQIREYFLKQGGKPALLIPRNTRTNPSGPFGKVCICAEYTTDDNEIFCCHYSRGSLKQRAGKKTIVPVFLPYLSNLLNRYQTQKEKKIWINTCFAVAKGKTL